MENRKRHVPVDRNAPPMFGTLLASKPSKGLAGAMGSTIGSVIVHAIVIAGLVYATARAANAPPPKETVSLITLPDAPPPPPPPPPPPMEDVPPPVPSAEPVAKGFQTLAVPDIVPPTIPPPQVGVVITERDFQATGIAGGRADGDSTSTRTTDDLTAGPVFTPMSVQPKLTNRTEVAAAVTRNYPTMMRDAGIGGTTVMWFLLDETGKTIKFQVQKPSGYPQLDEAAKKVAPTMKFTPAQMQDKNISVWVQVPIVFRVN